MMCTHFLIEKLYATHDLEVESLKKIIDECGDDRKYDRLMDLALRTREIYYEKKVYLRALLEFTNYCDNNCFYCGIRRDNKTISRYRLSIEEIKMCCGRAYSLGYRTFVLQGGEDRFFSTDLLSDLLQTLKKHYPDAAVTLSIGELRKESYQQLFHSGADRYLLRQEAFCPAIYHKLHPDMSFENRIRCLYDLKEIGYQTGAGFIVGLPGQDSLQLAKELKFIKSLDADMVGIGPLIVHPQTPLKNFKNGSVRKTFILLALIRLLLPQALIPISTAVNTLEKRGWEMGLMSGANVLMPVISPEIMRKNYEIYTGKNNVDVSKLENIKKRIQTAGFTTDMSRGDRYHFKGEKR
ncbi:MAG: [FeFe] hydrogenase H-cluster radical SAM maturase HydE [Thermotogota bacterium]|nr:[FeFe] hydrogenase H-cluster radical SAM maturase HydE [Thermotogota bacterium]